MSAWLIISWDRWMKEPDSFVFSMLAMLMLLYALSLFFIYIYGTNRPFRIYRKGLTLRRVPFRLGIRRKDFFVPFEKVDTVRIQKEFANKPIFRFEFSTDLDFIGRDLSLYHKDVSEIERCIEIVRDTIPEKVREVDEES